MLISGTSAAVVAFVRGYFRNVCGRAETSTVAFDK